VARKSEGLVGKLGDIAMSVPEPWKTAVFDKYTCGIEVTGQTDSDIAPDGKQPTQP
jgi:hypothetical protein